MIWVLALLALLAAGVAADYRSDAVVARNRLDAAQARALADAGVNLAILEILDPNPPTPLRPDGSTQTLQYGDQTIAVAIEDEGGKIDLNLAPIELIGGLLDEFGASADEHAAVLAGILDRRQAAAANASAPQRFFAGAAAQRTDLSKLAFADVSELRLLSGMTRGTYERIKPYLTVYAQSQTINPQTAARATLLAIPGVSPQEVEFLLASRGQSLDNNAAKPTLSGVDRYVGQTPLRAATIIAAASTPQGAFFAREAIVTLAPNLGGNFQIVQWRQLVGPSPSLAATLG